MLLASTCKIITTSGMVLGLPKLWDRPEPNIEPSCFFIFFWGILGSFTLATAMIGGIPPESSALIAISRAISTCREFSAQGLGLFKSFECCTIYSIASGNLWHSELENHHRNSGFEQIEQIEHSDFPVRYVSHYQRVSNPWISQYDPLLNTVKHLFLVNAQKKKLSKSGEIGKSSNEWRCPAEKINGEWGQQFQP